MKTRLFYIIPGLMALLILLVACSSSAVITTTLSPSSTSSVDGASLVQERCTACHSLSRVQNARFSAAEWKTVVDLMISRGAQLTPDEETVVVNWLAVNYGN